MSASAPNAAPFGALERTLAWRYLRAKREHGGASLISIISFVGIFFAVAALIITMSIMSGFRATLLNALLGGQPHVYVNVEGYSVDEVDTLVSRLASVEGVESATPSIERYVLATAGDLKAPAIVRAVSPEILATLPFVQRSKIDPVTMRYGVSEDGASNVLMGLFLAQGREGLRVLPGDEFTITTDASTPTPLGTSVPRRKTFTVGHIFETGSIELDKLYIFMPIDQAQLLFNMKGQYGRIDVRLEDPYKAPAIKNSLADATGFTLAPTEFGDWMSDRKEYLNALAVERQMVRLLVFVIMAIATLNIIVGVVMLVKNKARDIAILRTMGLSQGAVMRVFVMVGTVLGTLGALLGVVVGVLFVQNIGPIEAFINFFVPGDIFDAEVYGLNKLPAILDWNEVIRTAAYAIIMAAVVSILPARWAARQDPVAALRFE